MLTNTSTGNCCCSISMSNCSVAAGEAVDTEANAHATACRALPPGAV